MASNSRSGDGNGGLIVLVAVAVCVFLYTRESSGPDQSRKPEPETALSAEIREAFDGDVESAESFGAFYSICASSLATESGTDLSKLRANWVKTKELLELKSPSKFGDIVSRELKPFEGSRVDRDEYSAALRRLSDACRKAARK